MESSDWKRRAAWLKAVAAHVDKREISLMLSHYADEMLAKAEVADSSVHRRRIAYLRAAAPLEGSIVRDLPA